MDYLPLLLTKESLSLIKPDKIFRSKQQKKTISKEGEILSSSKGPCPLCEQKEYINYTPEIDKKNGFQGAIYGMVAEILMGE